MQKLIALVVSFAFSLGLAGPAAAQQQGAAPAPKAEGETAVKAEKKQPAASKAQKKPSKKQAAVKAEKKQAPAEKKESAAEKKQ